MRANPMVEAIMGGTATVEDVVRWNVERMDRWFAATDRHHTAEECRNGKNCCHAPGSTDMDHRNRIAGEVA